MIYARVVSIGMLLVLLCFYLFSDTYIAFLLLSVISILFAASFMLYAFVKHKLIMEIKSDYSMYKMQEGQLHLIVENKSILPIVRMTCHVQIQNVLINEYYHQEIFIAVTGKSKSVIPIHIKSEYVGKLDISLDKVTIYDLTSIFSFSKSMSERTSLNILPHQYPINLLENKHYIASADRFNVGEKKGIDSQEIIGMKEYEPTDNIKHVHWKLSSKLGELVVKEIGAPLDASYCILVETAVDMDYPSKIAALIESVYSLSHALIAKGHVHNVGWYDQRYHYFVLHEIDATDSLHHHLTDLLSIQFNVTQPSSLEAYAQEPLVASNVFYFTSSNQEGNSVLDNRVSRLTLQCVINEEEKSRLHNNEVISFTPQTMEKDLETILY